MHLTSELIKAALSKRLTVNPDDLNRPGITLREVLALSPVAINSIDIMEAFLGALADNGAVQDLGLPAITLDDILDEVIGLILSNIEKTTDRVAVQP